MVIIARHVKYELKGRFHTHPVKDKRQLKEIMMYLLKKREIAIQKKQEARAWQYDRNWMMCLIGFNTAFRAEDLLQLRVMDVYSGYVRIKENKTGKMQMFRMNKKLIDDIQDYVKRNKLTDYDYMFPSQRSDGVIRAISRQQADRILHDIKQNMHIDYIFAMHSMRKTFGYQYYADTGDLLTIMKMYNHARPDETMLYIMWSTTDVEKARESVYIGGTHKQPKTVKSR